MVHGSPQVVLLAVDFHDYFIDIEYIAVAAVLSLQSSGIESAELDAPQTDRFPSDDDPVLRQ